MAFENIFSQVVDGVLASQMYNGRPKSQLSQAEIDGAVPNQYYLHDYKNAKRFTPANTPVRQKFNGYVNFTFNSEVDVDFLNDAEFRNTLSSLVKTAQFPTAEFQTDVKNQYNRKRITVSGVEFKPISITAYDTVDSMWVVLLMKMYSHLFQNPLNKYSVNGGNVSPKNIDYDVVPKSVASGGAESTGSSFNRPFDSNRSGLNLRPGNQRNFISHMDVVQYHGQKATKFTLFNPMITSFEIEAIDHADSQPSLITMNIDYENFTMHPKVNDWISEDELKRFSDFNKGEWQLAQNGNANAANTPGGSNPASVPISMSTRELDFLNGEGEQKIGRTDQVEFLDAFSNNE